MTRGRSHAVDWIVAHYTATLASTHDNAIFFSRNEGQGSSAHYFIDDLSHEIYQSVAEGDTAWHADDWTTNCRAAGIEVVSADEDYSAVEMAKLTWLAGKLMVKYGIGAAGVIRHYDVTRKRCPAPYVAEAEWAALKARITGGGAGTDMSGRGCGAAPSGSVVELAQAVIRGDYGNGDARRAALGTNYDTVQARVNEILGAGGSSRGSSGGVDIDSLARAVIRGDYGNGDERRLGSLYDTVQTRVNEILL